MSFKKSRVNWHETASCAFQIELKDYSDHLEYITEYVLGKNSYRIDLLIIKKLTDEIIPRNIALLFKTFNLLEVKGIGSSVTFELPLSTEADETSSEGEKINCCKSLSGSISYQ